MVYSVLIEVGIIILFAAIFANISRFLKQPLILGYVIAGVLVGPAVFGLVKNMDLVSGLSELGIALLLFIVGLELNIKKLKDVGFSGSITGVLQVIITAGIGAAIAYMFLPTTEALYVGFIIAFSSTMIVVKLLSDKGEIDTLHGKLMLAILIIQDVLVVMLLPILNGISNFSWIIILEELGKGIGILGIGYLTSRFLISGILKHSAKSLELLFITSVSICFLFAALAYYLGFSIAIGAFIAGVCIASLPYSFEIVSRVKSLKDFFIVIFFVTLGSQITFNNVASNLELIFILLALIIILKPVVIFILLKLFKYNNKTSFITGIGLGQVSEFSLVLAASGLAVKQISQDLFNVVIIVAIVSITLTPYFVNYSARIFNRISGMLQPLERLSRRNLEKLPGNMKNHIIIFGAHRMGSKLIESLKTATNNFIVVDFNPDRIRELISEGVNCIYGDISSIEVLERLEMKNAKIIISTVPDLDQNLFVLKKARAAKKEIIFFACAKNIDDSIVLYRNGVDFVAFPELIAGQKIFDYLVHLDEAEVRKWGIVYYRDMLKEKRKNPLIV